MKKLFAASYGLIYLFLPSTAYALPIIENSTQKAARLTNEHIYNTWSSIYGISNLVLILLFLSLLILIIFRFIRHKSVKNPFLFLITVIILYFIFSWLFSYFVPIPESFYF